MSDRVDLTEYDDPEDARLLDELRDVVGQIDPVPPEVHEAARAAFGWRRLDADLAELLQDTALDDDRLAGVRTAGSSGPRLLTFEVDHLTVEVEVTSVGERRRLVGQLVPPQAATVEVRHRTATTALGADHLGRFAAEVVRGPASLRCRLASGTVVETGWVNL